ncbi:MAG: hypothetical protein LUC85_08645 [Bacteroidales bacterium]|nr:hypothetical protein [Bacteroidales bacterium]MCD8394883.1 hypothetical protein [Bacteroidales bacterium]
MATYTQKQSLSWGTTLITICIVLLFAAICLWGKSWEDGLGWGLAIKLVDGKCYVISCQDPAALAEIITDHK